MRYATLQTLHALCTAMCFIRVQFDFYEFKPHYTQTHTHTRTVSHFDSIKLISVLFLVFTFDSCHLQQWLFTAARNKSCDSFTLSDTRKDKEREREKAAATTAKKTMAKMSPDFSWNLLNALLFSKRCQVQLNSIVFPFELVPPLTILLILESSAAASMCVISRNFQFFS